MRIEDELIPLPRNIRAKKSLGQNFLTDKSIALKIVEALSLESTDTVIEVGSGAGAITSLIAPDCAKMYAVEIDRDLLKPLSDKMSQYSNTTIINKDILKTDIDTLFDTSKGYKAVANLPYYITTPVIMKFIDSKNTPDIMVFMMQKEVAERICEKEGSRIYGSLTIYIAYRYKVEVVTYVEPSCFIPSPLVTSTVLKFTKREKPYVDVLSEELFFKVVRGGFSQRRKKLSNSLAGVSDLGISREQIEEILCDLGLRCDARAESLSIQDFAKLTNRIYDLKNK
ncbi:MAG: 16S rRNA (adenine(1518)-N(6)/adenine(1519)-N(6))-dimethyltransferase RsmA [Clostridia bacterium]|jgi:16S rRNA (adenine1518-N6/adenine1519-N6)-dimethyltransferase